MIPVNETRVLLKGFKDNPERQYINANYVQGPHSEPNYYIATQVNGREGVVWLTGDGMVDWGWYG